MIAFVFMLILCGCISLFIFLLYLALMFQAMLEETLTKNLHLQQDLENMSQVTTMSSSSSGRNYISTPLGFDSEFLNFQFPGGCPALKISCYSKHVKKKICDGIKVMKPMIIEQLLSLINGHWQVILTNQCQ